MASSASSSRPPPATSAERPGRQARRLGRLGGDRGEHGVGVRRGRRAAQHDRVARLQAQRRRVDRHVRPRLVDDRDDAERHAHLAHVEPVRRAGTPSSTSPTGSGRATMSRTPRGHPRDPVLVEREPVHQRGGEPGLAPGLEVARVGLQDLRRPRLERVGDREQRPVLRAGVERGEHPRSGLRRPADLGDGLGRDGHAAKSRASSGPPRGPSGEHEVVPVDRLVGRARQHLADLRALHAHARSAARRRSS